MKPIAVYSAHIDRFRPLVAALERRGIAFLTVDPERHWFDPADGRSPYGLVVHAGAEGGAPGSASLHFLRHLDRFGVPVVNGIRSAELVASKGRQLALFARLGIRAPRSRLIASARATRGALDDLRAPLRVRADAAGGGPRALCFESASAVGDAASRGKLDLGSDGTALVQELAPARDGVTARVELLGGKVLYALRSVAGATPVPFAPAEEIVRAAEQIAVAAELDAGSVAYFVDDRDGAPYFTGVHARFVPSGDPVDLLGFDPVERLVDYLATRVETRAPAPADEAFDRSG